jgi:hypothetical protein
MVQAGVSEDGQWSVRRSTWRLLGPASILTGSRRSEISRFSCLLFLSVRGFLDYARPKKPLACNLAVVLPSSTQDGVGILF